MRTVQQQNARTDWISNLSSGRTPPRARSVLTREAVFDAAGLACFDVRLVPNQGRLLRVTPSRRRGEMQLHRSIRRYASATTDIADGTDRTTVLPRSAHNSLGAGRDRKFSIVLSVTSRPARNRGPIGETGHRISLVQTAQNDDASLV